MVDKRIHCFVSGVVQGVFFRAHTKEWARSLGLKGWVRNTSDGRVELIAEGEEKALKELLKKLKQGPPAGQVEKIDCKWLEAKNRFDSFYVRFD